MMPMTIGDFDTAPFRFMASGLISAPHAAVFAQLHDPSKWFPLMSRSVWHGRACCVGARREVAVRMFGTFQEEILIWEPDVRVAFTMTDTNSPLVDRMGEDYKLTAELGGSRIDWTVAAHTTRLGKLATRPLKKVLGQMFAMYRSRLEKLAAAAQPEHGTQRP